MKIITPFLVLFSSLILVTLCAPGDMKTHHQLSRRDAEDSGDNVGLADVTDITSSECYEWGQLASGYIMNEEACEWWHNRNTIYTMDGQKQLNMETQCLTAIDMKLYSGGKYVGKIDYISMSWGFDVKIYDCRGKMIARAKEETSDIFLNAFRYKTKITLYDGEENPVGYSLRNSEDASTTIELQLEEDSPVAVWMAVRKEHSFAIFCQDPEWTVMRLPQYQANIDAGPLQDPLYITALVAVEGMKFSGDYDTCTVFAGVGIFLACVLVLALLGGVGFIVYKVFF